MALKNKSLNNSKKAVKKKRPNFNIAKSASPNQYNEAWKFKHKYYSQKELPASDLENLADNIIKTVVEDPKIKSFNEVLRRNFTNPWSINKFAERSEDIANAKRYAMFVIGINRNKAAIEANPNGTAFTHMQGLYDPQWKAQETHHAELRAKTDPNSPTKEDMEALMRDIMKKV